MRFTDVRSTGFVNGMLLIGLGATMIVPMSVDLVAGSPDWRVFAVSSTLTALVGGSLALACNRRDIRIDRRTGYLLTVSAWLVVAAFGSLPLVFSALDLSLADAMFETVSGLTTTGSTVLSGLDDMAPGLLLWRSLLQWIGGVGIVVTAIVLLPVLGIGGMQLFRMESSDISGKPTYSAYGLAGLIVAVYVGLSVACAIAYAAAGMSAFDAINHAMTTIATGGFSTHDASIGFFASPVIEAVCIMFMVSGAFPLIWYGIILTRPRGTLDQERQVPVLLAILVASIALVAGWNVLANDMSVGMALRVSSFNVTSVLTDTGFATADFAAWGSFAVGMLFMLLFIGGCAGSTSGAIKIFRWQILMAGLNTQLRLTLSPSRVAAVRFGGRTVGDPLLHSVRNFFFMYFMTFVVLSLMVMASGLDVLSSSSAVAQAMANAGPGLGSVGGPASNFSAFTPEAKWVLMAAMLVGSPGTELEFAL